MFGAALPVAAGMSLLQAGEATAMDAANCVGITGVPGQPRVALAYRKCSQATFEGYLQIIESDGKVSTSDEPSDPYQTLKIRVRTPGRVCARAWEWKGTYYIPRGQACTTIN